MHVLAAPKKQTNVHERFQFASSQLFILAGFQQTMGLPYLLPIFAGNASLHSSCIFLLSHFCFVI